MNLPSKLRTPVPKIKFTNVLSTSTSETSSILHFVFMIFIYAKTICYLVCFILDLGHAFLTQYYVTKIHPYCGNIHSFYWVNMPQNDFCYIISYIISYLIISYILSILLAWTSGFFLVFLKIRMFGWYTSICLGTELPGHEIQLYEIMPNYLPKCT